MTTAAADRDDSVALTVRVAEEIRGLMGRRNMSRVKLAEHLGQSRTYVGRRLSGETAFDLDDLESIAGVFGVPVAALLGIVPLTPTPNTDGPLTSGNGGSLRTGREGATVGGVVVRPLFGCPSPSRSAPEQEPAAGLPAANLLVAS